MQNKPNSRHQANREIGAPGSLSCETKPIYSERKHRIGALWKKTYDNLEPQKAAAKQSQFSAGRAGSAAGTEGAGVLHKSNSGSKGAKQTQFPVGGMPHHSTIPSFNCSSPVPFAPNKANFHQCADREIGVPGAVVRNKTNSDQKGIPDWQMADAFVA